MSNFPQLLTSESPPLIELIPLYNHQLSPKQNPEEDYFYWYYLKKFFPDLIKRHYQFQQYYPDFIYADEKASLYIDIECDEPYVYATEEPTHYQELDSEKERNLAFTEAGWIVIRFAEEQIVRYPESCCKYLAEIIASITNDKLLLEQFKQVIDLPSIPHWTQLEAEKLAQNNYRDSYLNNQDSSILPSSRQELINCLKSFVNVENDTQVRQIKETWALPINERVEQGKAISDLEIINQSGKQITVKFQENLSKFAVGDELLFNSGNPQNKDHRYECVLAEEKDNLLTLKFNQKINIGNSNLQQKWVLDLKLFDLRRLLLDTLKNLESDLNLQDKILNIIEGKIKPEFNNNLENLKKLKNNGFNLEKIDKLGLTNKQKEALTRALVTDNYYLIQGPPGTGKTWLLAHIAHLLAQQGQTVLITAFTHTAINNALKKIVQVTDYQQVIKIGKPYKTAGLTWENGLVNNYQNLKDSPYKHDTAGLIIGATCHSVGGNRLKEVKFDTIIFDEAGQINIPVAMRGMTGGSKYIFIGDHQQMPPVIAGVHRQSWVKKSIFETLFNHAPSTMLDVTHRLNQEINQFPSQYFYEGKLQPSAKAIARKLELPIQPQVYGDVLNPEMPSVFVEVPHQGQGLNSREEAEIIAEIVAETVGCGVNIHEIAVVVPYRSQARLIRQKLQELSTNFSQLDLNLVLVNTVESMQGQEKDIMIVSLTTSDPFHAAQKADFYFQPNRLNVAITRAKVKRIVVGSPHVFSAQPQQPLHQQWVKCFRSFYESNHRITISQPRGLNPSNFVLNNTNNLTKNQTYSNAHLSNNNQSLDLKNKQLPTLKKETNSKQKSKANKQNLDQEITDKKNILYKTEKLKNSTNDKIMTITDLAQYLQESSPSNNKTELTINFAPLLLEVLGFGKKQIKAKSPTNNGKEIVDFAIFQLNGQQKYQSFLLLAVENINLDFDSSSNQYQARVKKLQKDLLAPNFKNVKWGIITNSRQIQIFRKHGKVIYPASAIKELNPDNLEKFEQTINEIKTQLQQTPRALTVAIYNNKGGVGKTTTTINLAGILSLHKKKVLVIDFDCDQQDLTTTLGLKPTSTSLSECLMSRDKDINDAIVTYEKNLKNDATYGFDIIPCDTELVEGRDNLNRQLFKISRLRQLLKQLKPKYDYILIDTPPNWRELAQSSIYASDVVLIPNQHSRKSIKNAITFITKYLPEVREYKQNGGPISLPIMFNGGNATESQIKTIYDFIEKNIESYQQNNIDLTPYFFPHQNSLSKNRKIFHLPYHAYIEKAEDYNEPAVFRYKIAIENYQKFVKEYFI